MMLIRSAVARGARAAMGGVLIGTLVASGTGGALAQSPAASAGPDASPAAAYPAELIAAPGSTTLDLTYADWAAEWLNWILSAPASSSPMLVDACREQDAAIFNIPQTLPGTTLGISCETYGDQWLLSAGGAIVCDTIDHPGATDEDLAACAEEGRTAYTAVSITIDGQPIADLDAYWVTSTPFDLTLPEDNVLGVPAQTTHAVGGGWFVLVQPLAPGVHTLVLHNESAAPEGEPGPLVAEVTATVEVIP